jgi:hypothetical protein
VWAAGTRHGPEAIVGLAAAVLVGALCAQMLFLSDRMIGVAVTVLAAFTGAGAGVLLARVMGVDEPGRVLLSVAGSLVVATAFAFAMAAARPGARPGSKPEIHPGDPYEQDEPDEPDDPAPVGDGDAEPLSHPVP